MTPLTLSEVLNYWLESIQGTAKNIRPKGYERSGEHVDQEAELRARCAGLVESVVHVNPWMRQRLLDCLEAGQTVTGTFVAMIQEELQRHPIYRIREGNRPMRSLVPTYGLKDFALRLRKDNVKTSTWTLSKLFDLSTYNGNVWKDDKGKYVISELGLEAIKRDVQTGVRNLERVMVLTDGLSRTGRLDSTHYGS